MKHIWKAAKSMTGKEDMALVTSFLAMNTVVFGAAGCVLACVLGVIPVFAEVPFVQLLLICGGYGAFGAGLIGGAVYILIAEPERGKEPVKKAEKELSYDEHLNVKNA